jgi:hypothetical protein
VKTTTFSSIVVLKVLVLHIDDKYGIDVDETHRVNDLLDLQYKQKYAIKISKSDHPLEEDPLHIGYVKIKTVSV